MRILCIIVLALSLPGCIMYARWKEVAANADLKDQQAQLVRDFRQCLLDNSNNPPRQRDCSVYNQSRSQLDITGIK